MAHTAHRLLTATTLAAALATTLALPAHTAQAATPQTAADYPGHTTSRYVPLADSTPTQARQNGCAQARTGTSGVRILFFGTQEADDTLRAPGTSGDSTTPRSPYTKAAEHARHWAQGFTQCRTGNTTARLALGVNNKDDAHITGTHAGQRWADLVTTVQNTSATRAVTITTALDAEPSWSTPDWARDWLTAYTKATDTHLYAANSADSCPTDTSADCANGWTLADVHHMAGGNDPDISVIPQIYRTDGIQARQWANISRWGHTHTGDPLRFAGAMSQHTACEQRSCTNTDNTPQQAWKQLKTELDAHKSTRVTELGPATDMRWP